MKTTILCVAFAIFTNLINAQGVFTDLINLKEGKEHKFYHDNGKIRYIGKFDVENENRVGIHREYFNNGQLKSSVTFVDNNEIGPYEKYLENGSPSEKGNNGKKTGGLGGTYYGRIGFITYWYYYSNGQLEETFTKDKHADYNGNYESYYRNGQLKEKSNKYKYGDYSGNYESYYENGELHEKGVYINDEKEGEWYKYFIDNGNKFKVFYEKGEPVVSKSRLVNSINDSIEDKFYRLKFKNKCYKKIQIVVSFLNLEDKWQTKGFYNIEPNKEIYIENTYNKKFYYYAHSFDGKKVWVGSFPDTFKGSEYKFKEKTIPKSRPYGDFFTVITCNK